MKGLILPFRPKRSAHAYQQIWTSAGSPLLIYSRQLVKALASALGENYYVALGMRYGQPSIESALQELQAQQCRKLIILPLFPQYSSAATGSAIEKTLSLIQKFTEIPEIQVINSFYDHPGFITAWRSLIMANLPSQPPDRWIFSYHGLPVRQLDKRGCQTQACLKEIECKAVTADNAACYRRQCFATSRLLAQALELQASQYQVSFQSRLGRTPWITPHTDEFLNKLASQGVKRIALVCPSFVTDCLETLEEIGIRAKNQWLNLGGTDFTLIPCLNIHPAWINTLTHVVNQN